VDGLVDLLDQAARRDLRLALATAGRRRIIACVLDAMDLRPASGDRSRRR
jgi:hypothetical protein